MRIANGLVAKYRDAAEEFETDFNLAATIKDSLEQLKYNQGVDWSYCRHQPIYHDYTEVSLDAIRVPRDIWSQLNQHCAGGINWQDVVGFAAYTYYQWWRAKMISEILSEQWSEDRLAAVLEHYGLLTVKSKSYKTRSSLNGRSMVTDCPWCGHSIVLIRNIATTVGYCHACGHKGDLWSDVEEQTGKTRGELAKEMWRLLGKGDSKPRMTAEEKAFAAEEARKAAEQEARRKAETDRKELEVLMADCDDSRLNYLYRRGFTREDCQALGITYRPMTPSMSAEYGGQSDTWRGHIVYPVNDIDGNIVGCQGRSVWDTKEERIAALEADQYYQSLVASANTKDHTRAAAMLAATNAKCRNTAGFAKSQHVYLLDRQVGGIYSNYFVICEGPKDALRLVSLRDLRIAPVSTLGACMSNTQADLIAKVLKSRDGWQMTTVVIAYDADESGVRGAVEAAEKLKARGISKIAHVIWETKKDGTPRYKDFGDMNCRQGTRAVVWRHIYGAIGTAEYVEMMGKTQDTLVAAN